MSTVIALPRSVFTPQSQEILSNDDFRAVARRYPSGIESITLKNSRGFVEVLPFMGGMIWNAEFDGISLRMKNFFDQPQPADVVQDTYGCFAFHSGLLTNGCPAPEDTHPLHGEFPCAPMDSAELVLEDNGRLSVRSYRTYTQGFGYKYRAVPSLTLAPDSGVFEIKLDVSNLSKYQPMPLQYMCHMNYAFVENGSMRENLPAGSFQLRRTVPAHVTPTPEWEELNRKILAGEYDAGSLEGAESFDPEIVYFADGIDRLVEEGEFFLDRPDGSAFVTRFSTKDFPVATRWVLHNPDQQVSAFVLPGTSRPEGYLAAEQAGTLVHLEPGETRAFRVETGLIDSETVKELKA